MKINIFLSLLLLFSSSVYSSEQTAKLTRVKQTELIESFIKPLTFLSSSYDEFKFSSSLGNQFNNYKGHTYFNALGGDTFKTPYFYWGFNGYSRRTTSDATSRLAIDLNQSHGLTDTAGLYVHVLKEIYFPVFIDLFAIYGKDQYKLTSTINGDTASGSTGFARYNGRNSTLGARFIFSQGYKQFMLMGDINYFYSRFHQPDYRISYPTFNLLTPALTTKTQTFIETMRLYYQANKNFSPFLSLGFIQLSDRDFSRPVLGSNFVKIAPLPEVVLGKNGYNYGAGMNIQYQNFRIIPVYTHSVRGSSYIDNFFGITLELIKRT